MERNLPRVRKAAGQFTQPETARQRRAVADAMFEPADGESDTPVLLGSKCVSCGEVVFPRLLDCPACFSFGTMRPVRVRGRGHLRDFVVAYRGPAGFDVPYIQAYVKLMEGPVIFTTIAGVNDAGELALGQEMVMSIEIVRSDGEVDVMGWKFRPVRP